MTLPDRCGRDLQETRVGPEFANRFDPEIPHAGSQSPDELVERPLQGAAMGDTPFDSLGYQFLLCSVAIVGWTLAVSFAAPMHHGSQRPHPPITLERSPQIYL